MVLGAIWFAFAHPLFFLAMFACFVLLMIWLLPKLWRGVRALFKTGDRALVPRGRTLGADP